MKSGLVTIVRSLLLTGTGALVFAAVGCADVRSDGGDGPVTSRDLGPQDTAAQADEAEPKLIAEVILPERTIRWYEDEEGSLTEVDRGKMIEEEADPLEMQLTGSNLYEYLTGEPAPQALLDAEERARPIDEDDGQGTALEDSVTAQPELINKTSWHEKDPTTRSTFRSKFCVATDRFYSRLNVTGRMANNHWYQHDAGGCIRRGRDRQLQRLL